MRENINSQASEGNLDLRVRQLLSPRNISKEVDSQGRDELASELRKSRHERREISSSIDEKKEHLEGLRKSRVSKEEASYEEIRKIQEAITQRQKSLIGRIKKLLRISDGYTDRLESNVGLIQNELSDASYQISDLEKDLGDLELRLQGMPEARDLLKAYYDSVAYMPLSQEQKRSLLKPESLSQLSLEQYIALWKRLNPHFLSHVTRQGFRDHSGMIHHSKGLEEFHNGLLEMMRDEGMLKPAMSLGRSDSRGRKSAKSWMEQGILTKETEEDAVAELDKYFEAKSELQWYPDRTSVHFSSQEVLNSYYGAERDNEAFIIFPTDFIASQYDFALEGDIDFEASEAERYADVFVWSNARDDVGIPVNAGIVFLPANTLVDSETGSKYFSRVVEIDNQEKRVVVKDEQLILKFVDWTKNLGMNQEILEKLEEHRTEGLYLKLEVENDLTKIIENKLQALGIDSNILFELSRRIMNELIYGELADEEVAKDIFIQSGAHYKRAENPIRSKYYWENYFEQHPDQRPRHLVYYDGDPTRAVLDFQKEHGIGRADTSKEHGPLLGFEDRHVKDMENDPRANRGLDELKRIALEIIREHFVNKQPVLESVI